jgi:arylmalonate decarboxylase
MISSGGCANMLDSRRDFLKCSVAAAIGSSALLAATPPSLGLIFPPAGRGVPEEGLAMYPNSVHFLVEGLGLKTMTPDGYDAVLERIVPAAQKLAKDGARAITLMGTSLSFYKGAAFNEKLGESMRKATGLPATTMSTAVVEGLRAVGGKRLAVATAYNDEVNGRLEAFLKESGFEVLIVQGLGIEKVEDINSVTQDGLIKFCASVHQKIPKADAMLVSCGGLRTLEIIAPLEKQTKIPVVSSTPHALRAGVRLMGMDGRAPGFGTLLAKA